jgi:hypothetical protein
MCRVLRVQDQPTRSSHGSGDVQSIGCAEDLYADPHIYVFRGKSGKLIKTFCTMARHAADRRRFTPLKRHLLHSNATEQGIPGGVLLATRRGETGPHRREEMLFGPIAAAFPVVPAAARMASALEGGWGHPEHPKQVRQRDWLKKSPLLASRPTLILAGPGDPSSALV